MMKTKIQKTQIYARFGVLARNAINSLSPTLDENKLYYEMFLTGDWWIWEVFQSRDEDDNVPVLMFRVKINAKTGEEDVELQPENLCEIGNDDD